MSAIVDDLCATGDSVISNFSCDIERDQPAIAAALFERRPELASLLARFRTSFPLPPTAKAGVQGPFVRLPIHYRSVALALRPAANLTELFTSDVLVFKGAEPLLQDFPDYFRWMMTAQLRSAELPMGLHFPLVLKMPPGAFPADECRKEWTTSMDVHAKHLAAFGTVAHSPVCLFIHDLPPQSIQEYLELARATLPSLAFQRIETRTAAGLSVGIHYYPSMPVRVFDIRNDSVLAALPRLKHKSELERIARSWIAQTARFLHLGYMPYASINLGWGACLDEGNACIDGGLADLVTLVPCSTFHSDHALRSALVASVEMLAKTITSLYDRLLASKSDQYHRMMVAAFVRTALLESLKQQLPAGFALERRITTCLEAHSIEDLIEFGVAPSNDQGAYRPPSVSTASVASA